MPFRRGDYSQLESGHGFVQWIFPIREHGALKPAIALTRQA